MSARLSLRISESLANRRLRPASVALVVVVVVVVVVVDVVTPVVVEAVVPDATVVVVFSPVQSERKMKYWTTMTSKKYLILLTNIEMIKKIKTWGSCS